MMIILLLALYIAVVFGILYLMCYNKTIVIEDPKKDPNEKPFTCNY